MFYIENLRLKGLRNYRNQELQFNPRLNVICGENAQGKTNLLEAIYYLSVTRSFRTKNDQELANREDGFFYLKGKFIKNGFNHEVQVSYIPKSPLKVKINSDPVNRYAHLQKFPVVVFSPDDLLLISEGPSIRRRFLNLEASRLSSIYFDELRSYQRVLQQRNHLLKSLYNRNRRQADELLEPWDKSLVMLGSRIIHSRLELIMDLAEEAKIFFQHMTSFTENISLFYESSIDYRESPEETGDAFYMALQEKRDLEIKRGSTVLGPHLDDLRIFIDGFDTRKYSSQGQKRTAALALKMAEVSLFKKEHEDYPIILLDDVFYEFDQGRKMHLLEFLKKSSGQCFISTAGDTGELIESLNRDYKIISIWQGRVCDEKSGPGN